MPNLVPADRIGLTGVAPNISKIPHQILRSSMTDRIIAENNEYRNACDAERKDRERLFENFKMYWGVDYGQWDEYVVEQLLDENRHPMTINLLSQKINTLAGAITTTDFNVEYQPINSMHTSLTKAFKDIYLSDKAFMRWDASFAVAARYGLIYRADEQMFIDRRKDPNGNIAFRTLPPGRAMYSPAWQSDDSNDCMVAWITHMMSIEQIAQAYGMPLPEIKTMLAMRKMAGAMYDATNMDLGKDHGVKYDNLKPVIETHRVVTVKTKRLVDPTKGYNGLPFPVAHPDKDREYLIAWGNQNNVNWEAVREVPYEDRVLKIFTYCPEISLTKALEDKPSEIQVARLDLFPWGADRCNGKWRGVVDLAKDIQQNINKHQSQKTHMINSAANGATFLNSNLTNGDMAKLDEIKRNKNNPSYVTDVDLDEVERTHFVMKDNPYDPALFNNESLMIELLDLVTPVPAAMSSRTESSRESGVLFQSKVAIAEVGMKTLNNGLKQHTIDKAQSYLRQAQLTYINKHRRFPNHNFTGITDINLEARIDGRKVVINDISAMPECYVLIKEDPNGLINRHMNRMQYTEMMRVLPPNLGLLQTWFGLRMAGTADMDDQDRIQFDTISAMEIQKAAFAYKTEIMNMAASQKQAEAMIAQLDMQLQQMMGAIGQQQQQALPTQYTEVEGEGTMPEEAQQNVIEFPAQGQESAEPEQGAALLQNTQ